MLKICQFCQRKIFESLGHFIHAENECCNNQLKEELAIQWESLYKVKFQNNNMFVYYGLTYIANNYSLLEQVSRNILSYSESNEFCLKQANDFLEFKITQEKLISVIQQYQVLQEDNLKIKEEFFLSLCESQSISLKKKVVFFDEEFCFRITEKSIRVIRDIMMSFDKIFQSIQQLYECNPGYQKEYWLIDLQSIRENPYIINIENCYLAYSKAKQKELYLNSCVSFCQNFSFFNHDEQFSMSISNILNTIDYLKDLKLQANQLQNIQENSLQFEIGKIDTNIIRFYKRNYKIHWFPLQLKRTVKINQFIMKNNKANIYQLDEVFLQRKNWRIIDENSIVISITDEETSINISIAKSNISSFQSKKAFSLQFSTKKKPSQKRLIKSQLNTDESFIFIIEPLLKELKI